MSVREQVENREAYRKTKIGTEVDHVTRDSDTTFKVKGQLPEDGAYCGSLPHIIIILLVIVQFTLIVIGYIFLLSINRHDLM